MAISHAFSNPVADGTVTSIVRPSDWNSAHNQFLTIAGNTAGQSTFSGTNIVIGGGPNVTLSGVNATRVDISAGAGGAGDGFNILAAGTQTAGTASTVVLSNANGISFGMSNSSQITASYTVPSTAGLISAVNVSAGTTSNNLSAITFNNTSGISFGLNGSVLTAAFLYSVSAGAALEAARGVTFSNSNNISFGLTNGVITASASAQSNQTGGIYVTAQSTGQSSSSTYDLRTLSFVPDGIISAGWSNGSFRVSATQSNQAFSAAGGSSAFQTLGFSDTNGVSFSNSNGSVVATVRTDYASAAHGHTLTISATSNTTQSSTGTMPMSSMIIAGAGGVSVGISNGSIVVSGAGAGTVNQTGPNIGVSNLGNTAGSTGTVSTGNVVFVGTNGITLSQSTGAIGSNATITIGAGQPVISSYQNVDWGPQFAFGIGGLTNSTSIGGAFMLPLSGSFSYLRMLASMSTNSTTIATIASATASASAGIFHTANAVIYSLGTGASSRSLMSVASGSGGFSFTQQISITNSTQYSVSQGVTFEVEGLAGRTNQTTQYSISNTNYSFTTNQIATLFSLDRFLDTPFANSLTPGPYWMLFGISTSSGSGGAAGLANMSNCHVRVGGVYINSGIDLRSIGIMGSTNRTSAGAMLGAASFSTNGGTTSALPMSALSWGSSGGKPFFQLIRQA